jgi:MHS family proline/betaine transporter-like MFS transporter
MQESPEFERQVAVNSVPERPWRHSLANHKLGIARAFAVSALGSITYYVGITYVPAFLTSTGSMSEGDSLWLATAAAVAVSVVTPLTGVLSDRFGRKPVLLTVCVLSAILPITLFSAMAGGDFVQAVWGAILLACVAGAMSAVGAVATAEQFPGEGRVTGLAFGATGATAIFGGLTPYLAQRLVDGTGQASVPGVMIAIVAVAVLPVFFLMKETAPLR